MGAGLAKQLRDKYPGLYEEYKKYFNFANSKSLLGDCQLVLVSDGKIIANLFGQLDYGRDKQYTNYNALKQALALAFNFAKENKMSVAIPYGLGCGLAGGDWKEVYKIIKEVFDDYDVTIYKL